MQSAEKHVFVVGLDEFNRRELEKLNQYEGFENCRFHELLSYGDLGQTRSESFEKLLGKARAILESADTPVDGIMTFWDFPAQTLVPLLCREFKLASCNINELEKCEHKYWARKLQREHAPEATPNFAAVNPFDKDQKMPDLDYPFWLKPVKSYSSYLAYKIESKAEFEASLNVIREHIDNVAKPYNEMLSHLDLPEDIARVDGYWCIAEEVMEGEQCTVEGYCYDGEFHCHGVIDSIDEKGGSSFARYQYPSCLPEDVQQRMLDISKRLMTGIGYSHGAFNIEFFYNLDNGDLKILEVNPRISQSHSELFWMVDGLSNEAIPLSLALGMKPDFPYRKGERKMAGKFFLRVHDDAWVSEAPGADDIRRIKERFPDTEIKIQAKPQAWLSEEELHDSYSFELAQVFIGGDNEDELLSRYRQIVDMMHFKLEKTEEDMTQLTSEWRQPRAPHCGLRHG